MLLLPVLSSLREVVGWEWFGVRGGWWWGEGWLGGVMVVEVGGWWWGERRARERRKGWEGAGGGGKGGREGGKMTFIFANCF